MKNRVEFYHSLATLLEAGLPPSRALRRRFPGSFRRSGSRLARQIEAGLSLHQAMRQQRGFSAFECNLVQAGESSGRLPETLRSLSQWFELQLKLRGKLISGLLYPLFLYFISCFLLAVIAYFSGGTDSDDILARLIAQLLLPLAIYLLFKLFRKFLLSFAIVGRLIDLLPVMGRLQHSLETARFCKALGFALNSGLGIQACITLAANCCRNAAYRRRFLRMNRILARGNCNFAQAFQRIGSRRDRHAALGEMLDTGEQSGQLEVYCDRIAKLLNAETELVFERIGVLLPFFVYLLMIFFVTMQIIKLASSYGNMLQNLIDQPF